MSYNSNKDWAAFVPEIKWTLWDKITMPFYLMEEKKNRFFELFSKWFFNLWD